MGCDPDNEYGPQWDRFIRHVSDPANKEIRTTAIKAVPSLTALTARLTVDPTEWVSLPTKLLVKQLMMKFLTKAGTGARLASLACRRQKRSVSVCKSKSNEKQACCQEAAVQHVARSYPGAVRGL